MNKSLLIIELLIILFSSNQGFCQSELNEATKFFESHPSINDKLQKLLGKKNSKLALSIVAPEVLEYSSLSDLAETYTLKVLYAQLGQGNFSIGYFQMKPTFAKLIEDSIKIKNELKNKYQELLIYEESSQAERAERIKRLSSLKYQTLYLAAFFELAYSKIKHWESNAIDAYQLLRNLATLYNGGLNLSELRVLELQKKKQFPSMSKKKYNYSDLVVEFYKLYLE